MQPPTGFTFARELDDADERGKGLENVGRSTSVGVPELADGCG